MDLYYYRSSYGNFGDDLNTWIWDHLLPGWRDAWPEQILIGVGTLINNGLPRGRTKLVVGSGAGYGAVPDADLMSECRFVSVRGPRSAAVLGLPLSRGIIDPAIMLSDFAEFQNLPRGGRPIFVPHEASMHRNDWARLCDAAGMDYVSPGGDAKEVIKRLATAPYVVAESMHAAIIADTFGTPWHAVSISHRFNGEKWLDWADSLGVIPQIKPLYPLMNLIAQLFPRRSKPAQPRHGQTETSKPKKSVPMQQQGGSRRGGLRRRLRMAIEAIQTRTALSRFANTEGQLSDRAVLEVAKAQYREVLVDLCREISEARRKHT